MGLGKHILVWIALLAVEVVLLVMASDARSVVERTMTEIQTAKRTLGADAVNRAVDTANQVYQAVKAAVGEHEQTSGAKGAPFSSVIARADQRLRHAITIALTLLYRAVFRLSLHAYWMPIIATVCAAAIVDGWATRARKKYEFEFTNPVRFNSGRHVLVLLSFLPVALVASPLELPTLLVPVWGIAVAAALWVMVANIQQAST